MLGGLLLRLLYVKIRPPERFYAASAEGACSTGASIVVDVGGATGLLYHAISKRCRPQLYVILEPDVALLAEGVQGVAVERVAADARHPPLRSIDAVAVFHDALHHVPRWERHLDEMLEPYRCTVIEDYDVSTVKGRLLKLAERLFGFPAEFTTRSMVEKLLESRGFRILHAEGEFPYLIVACRPRHWGASKTTRRGA